MEDTTTILFGLPDVAVERVECADGGARTVHVVTDDDSAAACPVCGVLSTSVRQRRTTRPKDLPYGEAPLVMRWHKVQWRCREATCPRKAFTESIAELPPGARVTGRLRRHAGRAVGEGQSVAGVAAGLPLSWPTVHAAFVTHAEERLVEPAPTEVLGIDETRRGRPRWSLDPVTGRWVRLERFETNFVDLAGSGGLLGQTAGRTVAAVTDWLAARSEQWRDGVRVVAMDPCATYRRAVTDALPHARIVADHFHLVRLANQAVTEVRQRTTRDTLGRRGRRSDPAWAARRRLLRGRERLTEKQFTRMWNDLVDAEPTGQLLAAWIAKEELRALLATARAGGQRHKDALWTLAGRDIRGSGFRSNVQFPDCERQQDPERRAVTDDRVHLYPAVVCGGEPGDDGQPEPGAAGAASPRLLRPVEPFEDPFCLCRSQPWTVVGDFEHRLGRLRGIAAYLSNLNSAGAGGTSSPS